MIFYLSGTGNSLWAARHIASETGDRLIPIADIYKKSNFFTLSEGERVGFVFPVHGWRPPKIVRRFISGLDIEYSEGNYSFALTTAGDNIGETISILEGDLKKRGIRLDAAFSLIMPESYVGLPFMDVDTEEKEKLKISTSGKRLERYAETIRMRRHGKTDLDIGRWPRINSRIIGSFFNRYLVKDGPFKVSEDKCVKCGMCVKACPTGNMIGGHGTFPEWKHTGDCMTCFACYHHCPRHAIEFGRQTKGKGQYYFGKDR